MCVRGGKGINQCTAEVEVTAWGYSNSGSHCTRSPLRARGRSASPEKAYWHYAQVDSHRAKQQKKKRQSPMRWWEEPRVPKVVRSAQNRGAVNRARWIVVAVVRVHVVTQVRGAGGFAGAGDRE